MTQTEALNLALDALEHCKDVIEERGLNGNPEFAKMWGLTLSIDRANQAITAIKEALAQPEHEPVAWLVYAKGSRRYFTLTFDVEKVPEIYKGGEAVPLYTTPPQRKPLTDEQILTVVRDHYNPYQRPEISFARAIEAAHGIKE